MTFLLVIAQIVLPVAWYALPGAGALSWWVVFMPTWIALVMNLRAAIIFWFIERWGR